MSDKIHAKDIHTSSIHHEPSSELYGKRICVTGTLSLLKRSDLWRILSDIGGIPVEGMTKDIDILIVGKNVHESAQPDGISAKRKKAERMMTEGHPIRLLTESELYKMILQNYLLHIVA